MAVELEKIASMLESAHDNVETLEVENTGLKKEIEALTSQLELQKEASDNNWDNGSDMGSAVEYSAPEHATAENRLDSFLAD